jgi:hypothetical protein
MGVLNRPIMRTVRPNVAPAAGGEFSFIPKSGGGWLVLTMRFILQASAAVANREVSLRLTDSENAYAQFGATTIQTANQGIAYVAYPGASNGANIGTLKTVDWPTLGLWVPPGHVLSSATTSMQGADQYSLIFARVIEYPSGPNSELWPLGPTTPMPAELL